MINPRAKSFESQTTNPNHQFPFWNNNYKKSWKKKQKTTSTSRKGALNGGNWNTAEICQALLLDGSFLCPRGANQETKAKTNQPVSYRNPFRNNVASTMIPKKTISGAMLQKDPN